MNFKSDNWFLADDFSGALEVGAAWKKSGIHIDVILDPKMPGHDDALVGFSSETRNASPADAGDRITEILGNAGDRNLRFKKIDSTMRGPVGAELTSISRFFPGRPILFTPANTDAGRTVQKGRLFVDEVPVSETAFNRDPLWPISGDSIQEIITVTGGPSSGLISLDSETSSDAEMQEALKANWKQSQIVIVDSKSEVQLEKWVRVAQEIAPGFLPCGSGGLARAMDAAGVLSDLKPESHKSRPGREHVLFVIGSLHPKSRNQIEYVAKLTGVPINYVSPDAQEDQDWPQIFEMGKGALILATQVPEENVHSELESVHRYSEKLAKITSQLYKEGLVDTLFVTGGETARAVLDRLDDVRLELEDEFQPGVSVSILTSSSGQTTRLLVKPGGFGGRELLAQILSFYGKH